jgi:hypothetical protein
MPFKQDVDIPVVHIELNGVISTAEERIKAVEDTINRIKAAKPNLLDMGIDFEVGILVANIGIASMLLTAKPSIAIDTSFE